MKMFNVHIVEDIMSSKKRNTEKCLYYYFLEFLTQRVKTDPYYSSFTVRPTITKLIS